jgi:hypothetical protein
MPISTQSLVEDINISSKTELVSAVKMPKEPLVLKISAGNNPTPCKFEISF